MCRPLALLVVPALLLSVLPTCSVAIHAQSPSILVAAPLFGHSGDTIYLSGSGYAPRKHLYVMMACPTWYEKTTMEYGNIKFQQDGPTTGDDGSFRAFPFAALTLRHWQSLGCTIYTSDGASSYGPAFPAQYTLAQPGVALPSRWKRVKVAPTPQRVHSGSTEKIRISSWNGATADVTVSYAGSKAFLRNVNLDLHGSASVDVPVTLRKPGPLEAKVQVRVRIGTQSTSGTGRFTIIH